MKKPLALVACAILFAPLAAQADYYALDTSHTSVIFGIKHMEMSITYGRFNKVTGTYTLDAAKPENTKFQLNIDANSVDTNDAKRDEHLTGPDFFNAGQFPLITFQSTKVEPAPGGDASMWNVTGDLTMHGVTKPVTLAVKKLGEGKGMMGDWRSGFVCQHTLLRSDYGITKFVNPNGPGIGDEVVITVSFEGVRQGDAPAGATGTVKTPAKAQVAAKPQAAGKVAAREAA